MKKLLFVALTAVGLTACVQNEELAVNKPTAAISFADSYVSNTSRAESPVITTANLAGFDVWAFMDEVGGTVLTDEDVVKSTSGAWGYSNIQYWFPEHTYYFAALAPMNSANVTETLATGAEAKLGLGEIAFTNVDGTEDLLYAKKSVETPGIVELTNNGMDAVKMQFQHLLSKVRFTFNNGFLTPGIKVVVTDVKMTAPKSGTINLAQATYNDQWVLGSEALTLEFGNVAELDATQSGVAANERFSIPATDAYKYNVTFHVVVWNGTVKAYELDKEAVIEGHALEMGKAYNFTAVLDHASLNLHKIEFTAEVDEWVDANNPETEIPVDYYVDTVGNYVVATEQGLQAIAEGINAGELPADTKIVLNNDIDLAELTSRSIEGNWTPIGTSSKPFTGTFDGQGYTIKNLVINGGSESYIGLFGNTHNGEIKNVTIENAKVSGYLGIGVVAGQPYTSKYTNITVKGHVEVDGFAYVGGVGGRNAYANWENITVNVDETSYVKAHSVNAEGTAYRTYVGGVVGFNGEGTHHFKNITSNINVLGSTIDVGGLFGIAHGGNKFENCVCTGNVEIYAAADEEDVQQIGGIAGVWNPYADVVMNNCSFTGTLKANNNFVINTTKFGNLVCSAYGDGAGKLFIDGIIYSANEETKTPVEATATALQTALANGENVLLTGDVAIAKSEAGSNAYGATGINVLNGQTIDGGGNSISVNAWGTWDSAISTTGGVIKNIKVTGGMRGIFVNHNSTHSEKVVLQNVTINGTVYTISCDQGTNQGLDAYNCVINGWTSYAGTIGNVYFENCSFGSGQGYKFCRPYAPTTFVGCDFCKGYEIDARAAVVLKNCTVNGEPVTSANLATLVTGNVANATVK